jgi:hypothetical protein
VHALAGASCTGCRGGGSSLPFCAARRCFKEHEVGVKEYYRESLQTPRYQ